MNHCLLALFLLAATPSFGNDFEILKPNDLAVETHKWQGMAVQTTLNCFFADRNDYRCFDTQSYARVRVDFRSFDPDGEIFLKENCDRIDKANSNACRVTILFIYDSFDELPVGGFAGHITLVVPEDYKGYVVARGRTNPSRQQLNKAITYIFQGSRFAPSAEPVDPAVDKKKLDAILSGKPLSKTDPAQSEIHGLGDKPLEADSTKTYGSCESYQNVEDCPILTRPKICDSSAPILSAIANKINEYFRDKNITMRVQDIMRSDIYSADNEGYCEFTVKTNGEMVLKAKYRLIDTNRFDVQMTDFVIQ